MNGKEKLIWAQNAQGYCYLTSYEAPLKEGFQRFSTSTPSEMDRIYAKIDKQEQAAYAKLTHEMYERRKDFIEQNLSNLRTRMANSNNNAEKDILRAWIQAFNNRMDRLLKGTIYGAAEIQKREAPIPAENKMLSVEEIRSDKKEGAVILHDLEKIVHVDLRSAKPETETVQ